MESSLDSCIEILNHGLSRRASPKDILEKELVRILELSVQQARNLPISSLPTLALDRTSCVATTSVQSENLHSIAQINLNSFKPDPLPFLVYWDELPSAPQANSKLKNHHTKERASWVASFKVFGMPNSLSLEEYRSQHPKYKQFISR
jgi:hypothetical protein